MLLSVPEHSNEFKTTGKTTRNGGKVLKPQPVIDYSSARKGVEMSDQMSSYNTSLRKTKKW